LRGRRRRESDRAADGAAENVGRLYESGGRGCLFGCSGFQKRLELDDLVVLQASQRGTLALNPRFRAELHELLTIDVQIFR
jgi:hypothetical protein